MLDKPFASPFDASFIELSSVDSTNNYALAALRGGKAKNGNAFFAHEQTAGKGQMGKKWASAKNGSIALSVIVDPKPLTLTQQFQLSAAVAVAAHSFLEKYTAGEVKIKWPNDLYWKDRKLGGILIESIVGREKNKSVILEKKNSPAWNWAVAGIGININQVHFSPDLPNPVSLLQITGKAFNPAELGRELHITVISNIQNLLKEGFDLILSKYIFNLYRLNETVRLRKGNRIFQTTIKSVSTDGRLVTIANGIEEEFNFGEISWII